eukprot:1184299-Prorocentrum_minimum.AAC.2
MGSPLRRMYSLWPERTRLSFAPCATVDATWQALAAVAAAAANGEYAYADNPYGERWHGCTTTVPIASTLTPACGSGRAGDYIEELMQPGQNGAGPSNCTSNGAPEGYPPSMDARHAGPPGMHPAGPPQQSGPPGSHPQPHPPPQQGHPDQGPRFPFYNYPPPGTAALPSRRPLGLDTDIRHP